MISIDDLYGVLCAVVPLYVTMFLAYASVKWWNIFTPEQCSGINRFVAYFAVPLLSMEFISRINPYKMDLLFMAADGVSKVLILVVLLCWANFSRRGSLEWAITLFSLSTLPNTLVMGIPLLKSMYGDDKEGLMIQVVVLQCIIWYTLLLFLFEYREARLKILKSFKGSSSSSSFSNSERSKGSFKGAGEALGSCGGNADEVVNVIVSTPTSQEITENVNTKVAPDPQQFRSMVAAAVDGDDKEVHLFIWRCVCCTSQGFCEQSVQVLRKEESIKRGLESEKTEGVEKNTAAVSSLSSAMLLRILKTVWLKLVRNPNSYASLIGLSWALVSCRYGIMKPQIVDNSVTILSKAGLGMAMFSLGLFMALQPRIIACGNRMAVYGMLARFLAGPAVMAVASIGVGLRGTMLKLSIVQAALPQGIVPFVFAREYGLHPDVLSTAVIFGMIVSLPITILYYIFLGL
ncbi:probable auxin efflux carrier component 1d isoform X1 [Populus alba]|uniref:Auxin efflux carrier component n=1 Tax=Populus alba TaxID=43335 RepID=A0A4U5R5R0_POPAL|nr:probable auxin efflux carrier component 1c isoform X1 [Populus alba]TKS18559.1 auxin efflux carrier component 3-like [Populus alba]